MAMTTPLIRAQSTLPALGRARPAQPGTRPDGAYRATLAFGSNLARPVDRAEADRETKLQAALQALRHPHSGKPGEQRSWSYLATEGGKGGARGR